MEVDDGDYCSDCKQVTQVVYDHSAGDTICTQCGLVLESHIADDTAEWRTFANDDGQDNDPVRVGAPSNPFLDGPGLSLLIQPKGQHTATDHTRQLSRASVSASVDKSHAPLLKALGGISDLCERLSVNKTVKDLACDIYSKVSPFNIKTRRDNSLIAACVHIASQRHNQSRTLKEMGMEARVAESKIVTAKKSIMKVLNEKIPISSTSMELLKTTGTRQQVNDYLKRFAYDVGLNNHAVKAAQEMLKNSEEYDIRRTPKSVAAGIVYITCLLCGHKRTARDISVVANTSEGTIKKAYDELHPYLTRIVPSWFAGQSNLDKLPSL